jgi:hypothetical protein
VNRALSNATTRIISVRLLVARLARTPRGASQLTEIVLTRYGEYTPDSTQGGFGKEKEAPKERQGTPARTLDVTAPSSGSGQYLASIGWALSTHCSMVFCQSRSVEVGDRSRATGGSSKRQLICPPRTAEASKSRGWFFPSTSVPLSQIYVLSSGVILTTANR